MAEEGKRLALRDTVVTSVPGICYKSEKVSDDTSSGDRISGNDGQFKGNVYFPSMEKTTINKIHLSGYVSESRNNSFRVHKGARLPDNKNFGHSPSKYPLSFSLTATNSGNDEKNFMAPFYGVQLPQG